MTMNMAVFQWAVGLLLPFLVAFAVWVVMSINRNKIELTQLKLHVAENYTKNEAMKDVFNELKRLSRVVYEIAGKLNVPIRND